MSKRRNINGPILGVSIPEMKHFGLSLLDAWILGRVRYLAPTSTVTCNSHRWVAWSITDWAEKLVVSESTISRSVRKLAKLRLIAAEVHQLYGKTRTFLRPLTVQIKQKAGTQNYSASSGSVSLPTESGEGAVKVPDPCNGDERTEEMREEECEAREDFLGDFQREEEGEEEEEMGTEQTECCEKDLRSYMSVEEVETVWRRAWAEHEGTFCPEWGQQDFRNLEQIATTAREARLDLADALRVVMENWWNFTEYANAEQGAYPQPGSPSLHWIARWSGCFARYCLAHFEECEETGLSNAPSTD